MSGYGQLGRGLGTSIGSFFSPQASQAGEMAGLQKIALEDRIEQGRLAAAAAQQQMAAEAAEAAMKTPEAGRQRVMQALGIPADASPLLDQQMNTGRIDQFDTGGRQGPVMPSPEWAQKPALDKFGQFFAADQAVQSGSATSMKDFFEGRGAQAEAGLTDLTASGSLDPLEATKRFYAMKGGAPYDFNEYGAGNNLTGALDTTQTGPLYVEGKQADIVRQRAQAGASNASAASSYASAAKSRAEMEAGVKGQYDAERGMMINPRTGVATPVQTADGAPLSPLYGGEGSGLPVLGVPQPTMLPWANQSNQRDANKVKAKEIERGAKEVEKDAELAAKERQTAQAAQRFMELNATVETGGITDRFGPTRSLKSLGSEYNEMESITARLAPGMREPGSGVSSDYDGKQFERATVGVDKPRKTNANIARAIAARSQLQQDYADFRQTYLEQNGTLQGADRYWKQYANSNPIFDPKKPGTFELNANRKSYMEHFAGKPGAAPSAAPPQPAGGIAKVKNDADYNALASGTRFQAPDGTVRVKP